MYIDPGVPFAAGILWRACSCFLYLLKQKKSWYSLCLRGCFNVVLVGVLDLGYKFLFVCVSVCACITI